VKSKKVRIRERRQKERRQRWLRTAVGLLALFALAAFVFWPRSQAEPLSPARLADDPSLGPANAPVTIVEYGDFGCPSCRAWHNAGILDQIRARYGDQVRFVWRDFPVITPQSPKAAEAAQCAYDQGKFWQYHDLLFARAPALALADLKTYAADIGLDAAQFNQCLNSGKHRATVRRDWQDAEAHGFLGTPSFLINNQPFVGPPTAEFLEQKIDAILASAG
jgi:protein-disulfide isomerase